MSSKQTKPGDAELIMVSFRARPQIVERIEAHAARKRAEDVGSVWSRSSSAHNLVALGLDYAEQLERNKSNPDL